MRTLILFLLSCLPCMIHATTISGTLKSERIHWSSAINHGGGGGQLVPSQWNIADGLAPTKEFILGGLANNAPDSIKMSGPGGTVNVPIKVIGFEYNLGSTASRIKPGDSQSGNLCTESGSIDSQFSLVGSVNCISSQSYLVEDGLTSANPYSFIRPIIDVDESGVATAFKDVTSGNYSGSIAVTSFYDYYVPGSVIRTRHKSTDIVTVELRYEGSFLTNVTLTGDQELDNIYDLVNNTVSGSTYFDVNASGYFKNGLYLSLSNTRSYYYMHGPDSTSIPYSIECIGCSDNQLVENGLPISTKSFVPGTDVSNVKFRVNVSFENSNLDSLSEGVYTDSFVLFVEPNL